MKTDASTTLASTEQRLRPVSFLVIALGDVVCAWLLSLSFAQVAWALWLPFALLAAALCLVNSYGFLGPGAAVGGMPVALMAIAPAALPAALGLPVGTPAQTASLALYFLSCAVIAYFVHWFGRLRRAYHTEAPPASDAALVVLGGYIVDGAPCRTVRQRLEVAERLWQESPARRLVLTGGPTTDGTTTEAEAMARWLIERGTVSADALLLEPRARNTEENLEFSQALLAAHGLSSRQFCIVTSDYHLYRALWYARNLGIDAVGAPAPVPLSSRLQQWCREVLVITTKHIG